MIGFPLRLLARENYDRVVARVGPEAVALVTGEERVVPPRPRATSSARSRRCRSSRPVDFLAVDEIQLAPTASAATSSRTASCTRAAARDDAPRRGHGRGPLLRRLVPEAAFIARPRLSTLRYVEPKKLDRLPRRSAVVVFSVRRASTPSRSACAAKRGGAAVVFGALSPRTRNAQVALYQAGEVDHLVATDAIGMGLNLDIDHVDVHRPRRSSTGAAPRAADARGGRARSRAAPGATCRTAPSAPPPSWARSRPASWTRSSRHRFRPLDRFFWRSSDLDFSSPHALAREPGSATPRSEALVRIAPADDQRALDALARDPEVRPLARGAGARAPAVGGVPGAGLPQRAHRRPHLAARRASSATCAARRGACPRTGWRRTCALSTGSTATLDALLARIAGHPDLDVRGASRRRGSRTRPTGRRQRGRWRTGSRTRSTSG